MLAHKHLPKIVAALMTAAVALCLSATLFSDKVLEAAGDSVLSMEYETKLFQTDEILAINLVMDEDEWQEMLSDAIEENYYECDAEINGETFYRVGIRPKGNTSLTSIANDPDTDRYSLKLEFDQYVESQICYGLDKLILNNNYADTTNMKEALIYDMFQYLGADASLYNYAKVSVNGEYWGVYLALEAVEDSFLLRNYGTKNGTLYKPEGMDIKNGGADLNYTDDDLNSYSTIWDGEVGKTTAADHRRVVTALKNISEGNQLDKYADTDNLLKYMAVHVFSVNEDSLSGRMAHNYYLYESDGQLNLLPWDYNLAFGGMGGGMGGSMGGSEAAAVVNSAIDEAFSGTDFFDTLMKNEEYQAQYYQYLRQLAEEYIQDGGLHAFYNRVRGQIDELVETDPTAFYTYEEYEKAADMLYETAKLRATSIRGQLDGTIPSTESGQKDSDALVEASAIDLGVMGTMDRGGGQRDGKPGFGFSQSGNAADREAGAEPPEGFEPTQGEEAFSEDSGNLQVSENRAAEAFAQAMQRPDVSGNMPDRDPQSRTGSSAAENLALYGICLVVMLAALAFAKIYRRGRR